MLANMYAAGADKRIVGPHGKILGRSKSAQNILLGGRNGDINKIQPMTSNDANDKFREIQPELKALFAECSEIWLGFEPPSDLSRIHVIVVVVKKKVDKIPAVYKGFKLVQRMQSEVSNEAMLCCKHESKQEISAEEYLKMNACLVKHSPNLLRCHSNIQVIGISKVKSRCFDSKAEKQTNIEDIPSVVLYVHIKGVIPFGEIEFPKELDGYSVDIREGCFLTYMQSDNHVYAHFQNLRMGCHIANVYQMSGSLGGFVRLQNKNIGCFTCWHLFDTEESRHAYEKDKLNHKHLKRDMYQPIPSFEHNNKIGVIVEAIKSEGSEQTIGVDAALIEITKKHREPIAGEFPNIEGLEYCEGEIVSSFEDVAAAIEQKFPVVKYGAATGFTRGNIKSFGNSVCTWNPNNHLTDHVRLHQQIEIFPENGTKGFADNGDSGALVLMISENDRVKNVYGLGMIVGGTTYGSCIVTPIWAVLDGFGLPRRLLTFTDQRIKKIYRGMDELKAGMTAMAMMIGGVKTEIATLSEKLDRIINHIMHVQVQNQ